MTRSPDPPGAAPSRPRTTPTPGADTVVTAHSTPRPSHVPPLDLADDPIIAGWERYEILELIGRGGMGTVYRARDRSLERDVALKFLRHDDPEMVERFRREARSQAQVDHDHVCRVYEVGEIGRHAYIAMQLLHGASLMEAGLRMDVRQKVRVAVDVARAVHAAHERGLIHRDLKPGNILVEGRPEGWHAYVLDFGIARLAREHELTEPGTIMGTMAYVAPEQARGDLGAIDRRSDVYSLGATLYALLSGGPPFPQGVGADTLWRVVHEEPLRLRRRSPEVPRDLETVVMTCLEKDPARRYATARALAEDLERVLDGRPIQARPVGPLGRLTRYLRRRPALASAIAAAVVIAALAVAVNLRTVRTSRLHNQLANRLAQQVADLESRERLSALLPLHDRSPERQLIRDRLTEIEQETEPLGSWARGPALFALGRGHLLLGEFRSAADELEAAWEAGYRVPADAFALGRAWGALYQQGLDQLQHIEDPAQRAAFEAEIQRRYRDRALAVLDDAGEGEAVQSAWAEGLIAFYDGQLDRALERARTAFAAAPWLHEAKVLEGDVELAAARDRLHRGDFEGARAAAARAETAFTTAADVARSDPASREGLCSVGLEAMEADLRTGTDPTPDFARTASACREALAINPESVSARNRLARAHDRLADALADRGQDPSEHLRAAQQLAVEAATLQPDSLEAHYNLGVSLMIEGVRDLTLGRDPRPALKRAVASLERAVALSPGFAPARDDLGYAWERTAKYELQRGIDPTAALERAVSSYRTALTLTPDAANVHNNLGIALLRRALWTAATGNDPAGDLDAAQASLQSALEINPNYANAHANLGFVLHARAEALAAQNRDPGPAIAQARSAFARAHAINPSLAWSWPELAGLELTAARWSRQHGVFPRRPLLAAETAVRTAIRLNGRSAVAWQRAAECDLERALSDRGSDRQRDVQHGLERVGHALALNPELADALLVRAQLLGLSDGNRVQSAAEAARALARAVELNPLLAARAEVIARAPDSK